MIRRDDILNLIEKDRGVRDLYLRASNKKYNKFCDKAIKAKPYLHLFEFLSTVYLDQNILVGPDGFFPIGVYELKTHDKANINDCLGEVLTGPKEKILLEPRVIEAFKSRGSRVWNGDTFSLHSLVVDTHGRVEKLNGYIGSFFDMICSASYLEMECLAAMEAENHSILLEDLPERKKILSRFMSSGDCLRLGGGVDAAIAVSSLLVYKRKGEYWALLDVLPKKKREYEELYHSVPALIFQPVTGQSEESLNVEWNIAHNIFREYLEELFGFPEVHGDGETVNPEYFSNHPNLLYLRNLIGEGQADLRGTGLAFNLLNHRPEILSLLLIRDESWFEEQSDPLKAKRSGLSSFSFRLDEPKEECHSQYITTYPLDDPSWLERLKPWRMVPPGGAAIVLGVKEAVRLLGIQQPPWLQEFFIKKN